MKYDHSFSLCILFFLCACGVATTSQNKTLYSIQNTNPYPMQSQIKKHLPFLQKNDAVVIISPSGATREPEKTIGFGKEILESWGLRVYVGKYAHEKFYRFAGKDKQRLYDLQESFDNPEIKAIFTSRGGYGLTRILDKLSWASFRKSPKWVVGYSDITSLHFALHQRNFMSIHGIMLSQYAAEGNQKSLQSLRKALFGEEYSIQALSHPTNRKGIAHAEIIGGNLSILVANIGTPTQVELEGKILFIEDVGEAPYRIDRMLGQLYRGGFLKKLSGLVVGTFSSMPENADYWGISIEEMIADYVKEYNYPVAYSFPIGHTEKNEAIRCGQKVFFEVNENEAFLRF